MGKGKVEYTYTGMLFSHKGKKILSFATKWVISLSERSQAQKDKHHIILWLDTKTVDLRVESRVVVTRGWVGIGVSVGEILVKEYKLQLHMKNKLSISTVHHGDYI
jgi:hypothetical protein